MPLTPEERYERRAAAGRRSAKIVIEKNPNHFAEIAREKHRKEIEAVGEDEYRRRRREWGRKRWQNRDGENTG